MRWFLVAAERQLSGLGVRSTEGKVASLVAFIATMLRRLLLASRLGYELMCSDESGEAHDNVLRPLFSFPLPHALTFPVDMCLRTRASNGRWTLRSVCDYARLSGLELFSLADVDLPHQPEIPNDLVDRYVPGILVRAAFGQHPVDLLVYGQIGKSSRLMTLLRQQRDDRVECVLETIWKLLATGVTISLKDVRNAAGEECRSILRSHIARALVEMRYAIDIDHAYLKFLAPGRSAYVEFPRLPAERVIAAAHQCRALVVVAQALKSESMLESLCGEGVDGLEVQYAGIAAADSARLERYARLRGLVLTGSGDARHRDVRVPAQLSPEDLGELRRRLRLRLRGNP